MQHIPKPQPFERSLHHRIKPQIDSRWAVAVGPVLERIAFDQVHLIKGDTQHNQRLACLGLPSI